MENGFILTLCCHFASSGCFLLQSAKPSMPTTTHNYEHLLLESLLDEKKLHSELGPRMKRLEDGITVLNTALEQQYNKTEAALEALKQAYSRENQLQEAYTRLQMELNNISQIHGPVTQRNYYLEMQIHNLSLNNIDLAKRNNDLETQVNNLVLRLDNLTKCEAHIHSLSLQLDNLTKRNNDIEMQTHNLSLNHKTLTNREKDLEMQMRNLSLHHDAMTKREADIEMQVHNLSVNHDALTKRENDIQSHFHNLSVHYGALTQRDDTLQAQVHNLTVKHDMLTKRDNDLAGQVNNLTRELAQDQRRLASADSRLLSVTTNISVYHAEFLELKQKQGHMAAFTVQDPVDGPSAETITFSNILTNIGNQFNTTTGNFTCVYPGVYVFILSIYQAYVANDAYCSIRLNSVQQTLVDSYSGFSSRNGYPEASKSIILHLNKGDIVDLGRCTFASSMHPLTTFSGILISSD